MAAGSHRNVSAQDGESFRPEVLDPVQGDLVIVGGAGQERYETGESDAKHMVVIC